MVGGTSPYRYFVDGANGAKRFQAWAQDSTLLEVQDANGCQASEWVFMPAVIEPLISVNGQGSCDNIQSFLQLTIQDTTQNYRFNFNNTGFVNANRWVGRPGTYPVEIIRNSDGCTWDTMAEIPFWQPIQVDLQAVSTIRLGDSITLSLFNGSVPSDLIVWWTSNQPMSCDMCFDPTVSPLSETVYQYSIIDTLHTCYRAAMHLVRVLPSTGLFVPTAFSPDGDGVNDIFWLAGGNSIAEVEQLDVFDRTGNLVYSNSHFAANNPTIGWDGNMGSSPASVGVYVFTLVFRTIDGQVFTQTGDLTLIR